MKQELWSYRNGLLIVERFTGTFNPEEIRKSYEVIVRKALKKNEPLTVLADLSNATFPHIEPVEIKELFATLDKNIETINGMRIALIANEEHYNEFVKASSYAIEATKRPITVMVFHSLTSATEWLELSSQEHQLITENLSK